MLVGYNSIAEQFFGDTCKGDQQTTLNLQWTHCCVAVASDGYSQILFCLNDLGWTVFIVSVQDSHFSMQKPVHFPSGGPE